MIERSFGCIDDLAGCIDDLAGCIDDLAGCIDDLAGVIDDLVGVIERSFGCSDDLAGVIERPDGVLGDPGVGTGRAGAGSVRRSGDTDAADPEIVRIDHVFIGHGDVIVAEGGLALGALVAGDDLDAAIVLPGVLGVAPLCKTEPSSEGSGDGRVSWEHAARVRKDGGLRASDG